MIFHKELTWLFNAREWKLFRTFEFFSFLNRIGKLMFEVMHIALKQFQFSLTVALGRPT